MLKAFALTQLGLKLGPDLVEELIETARVAGRDGTHATVGIHGHGSESFKLCGMQKGKDRSRLERVGLDWGRRSGVGAQRRKPTKKLG